MTYGRDFEPMAEISFDSCMILEFQAMSTSWPNVHCIVWMICIEMFSAWASYSDSQHSKLYNL